MTDHDPDPTTWCGARGGGESKWQCTLQAGHDGDHASPTALSRTTRATWPQDTDHDPVNAPAHYTSHPSGIECIQITEHFGFNIGNVIKYLWRAEEKGAPIEDLRKAAWYLDREIQRRKAAG